ncbi:hypothetical protein BD413DRAFT_488959 [Trametes elegans]|nr:hypothetical protein BD413DRAFT_488959 [Trametes elegans]
MDKLAVELLTYIAFFACTDGGYTGCALSLVSRRMRAASRPVRFCSVSLVTSPTQIVQFLDCFETEYARSPDMRPRVRHLCLSLFGGGLETAPNPPPAPPTSTAATPPSQPKSRAEFLASLQRRTQHWRAAQDTLDAQYERVVPTLLRAVAPDLRTLALIQVQWRSAQVVRCAFPRLRELTLLGGDPSFLPFSTLSSDCVLYPSLTRLHHILSWVGRDVDFLQWAAHAPHLTHLRVSRLDHTPRGTLDSLEHVLDERRSRAFPHLQHAILEPHPAPPPHGPAHAAFCAFLAHLAALAARARVPVRVLPPFDARKPLPPGMDPPWIRRVRHEWMDRVEREGAGCWREGVCDGQPA